MCSQTFSLDLAREVDEIFTEVLIAPDFTPEALEFLRKKKNRRVMRWYPGVLQQHRRVTWLTRCK